MRARTRSGFTLIELMVVVGIVGLLVSLTLPAVQSAREAARRVQCANNLRQLAVSMQTYETLWNMYPPGLMTPILRDPTSGAPYGASFSAHVSILSQLEQTQLYNAINFQSPGLWIGSLAGGANCTAALQQIETFVCPSDPWAFPAPYGPTNYRANLGICGYCQTGVDDGAFGEGTGYSPAEFTDGLSTTVAFAEKLVGGAPPGSYAPDRDWISRSPAEAETNPLLISVSQWVDFCSRRSYVLDERWMKYDAGRTWLRGGAQYTGFYVSVPPNSQVPDCGGYYTICIGVFSARSLHPGGVNAAMADGSVRFVSNGIGSAVWRAMGTRSGGEIISSGD